MLVGGEGTAENAKKLLPYGVDTVYVYEHSGFEGFRADCCADAVADCIAAIKPSSVLIGATALGRSLAPRLSTRFHTGLTADCTTLDIEPSTDMVQIRPAFGGNIMAQIAIRRSRPQFATVRYRVMDRAERVQDPTGSVVKCAVTDDMARSRIRILSSEVIEKQKTIDEEDILVVAGRGVRSEKDVAMCRRLAEALGGQLAFTRPMVENGFGDQIHQIGLSGRTVRPRLIITCGVSGAIQFTSCMKDAECIVAINSDPDAQIYQYFINYGIWCLILPALTQGLYALFFWYGMRYAYKHKTYDYRSFSNSLYGRTRPVMSNLYEICYLIMIGTASAAAFATGGSTIQTLSGLPYWLCTLIVGAFIFVIALYGTSMVRKCASTLSVLSDRSGARSRAEHHCSVAGDCGCHRPSGRRRDADHLQSERLVRFGALDGGAVFLLPARVGLGHVSAHGAGHGRQADQPRGHRHVCLQLCSNGAFHHRTARRCVCRGPRDRVCPDARSGAERRGRRRAHPDHFHFDHPRLDFDRRQHDLRHRYALCQRC